MRSSSCGFVLLAALALTSAKAQDLLVGESCPIRRVSCLNPELEGRVPELPLSPSLPSAPTPPTLDQSMVRSADLLFGDNVNLEWLEFDGSIPNGAVSIYNGYTARTDYVCKYQCEAGFYQPSLGPFCRYPNGEREYYASDFQILANKDNFEFLEWKEDSYGSVPKNSVRTCANVGKYVGKNKYGLGKVVAQFEAFFLPWEGDEYWYKKYQVLTINRDPCTQHISDVKYAIDEATILQNPPETMQLSDITNNECQSVSKTVTLSKTIEEETSWTNSYSFMIGASVSITAQIPFIVDGKVEFRSETTIQYDQGTKHVESISHSESVELTVPPNHSCSVRMEGRQFKADVPYSARLSRTYNNGDTQWTSITGTYNSVQIAEIRSVVDRCEPVPDARPCP